MIYVNIISAFWYVVVRVDYSFAASDLRLGVGEFAAAHILVSTTTLHHYPKLVHLLLLSPRTPQERLLLRSVSIIYPGRGFPKPVFRANGCCLERCV